MIGITSFRQFVFGGVLLFAACGVSQAASPSLSASSETPAANIPKQHSLRFGVCTHLRNVKGGWNIDILMPMIDQLGVCSFRDEFSWAGVERVKGEYRLDDAAEKIIRLARKLNLQPLLILDYGNKLYKNPLDAVAFANYANWLITHFKGKVDAFEIWNEPANFWFRQHYGGTWNARGPDNSDSPWLKNFADFAAYVTTAVSTESVSC